MLGDLGAEVIKIEHPVEGDATRGLATISGAPAFLPGGRTTMFEGANRNKKSITLNLQTEEGKEVVYRLVKKCDVFATNFRKVVAQRLGMGYANLSQYNPQLIYAITTGWGSQGEDSEQRVFDQLVQARSGLMWAAGDRDHPEPQLVQGAVIDQMGATMFAYGILAALLARERYGMGQEIEASLFGSAIHLQAVNVNTVAWQGRAIPRHSRTRARNPMDNHYRCRDGKWLRLAEVQADRFWKEFCETLGMAHLETEPRFATSEVRRQYNEELIEVLDGVFATRDRDEWLKAFTDRGCRFARAPITTMEDVLDDPQALANDYVVEFDHPTMGRVKTAGFPVKLSHTPMAIQSPAPEFGQHTEEVLQELGGYSWEEISEFRSRGVI
jgi:crotonobetainyl-CoA:carnitine CoA-transferase CaiB-like acyl-CoA transferase